MYPAVYYTLAVISHLVAMCQRHTVPELCSCQNIPEHVTTIPASIERDIVLTKPNCRSTDLPHYFPLRVCILHASQNGNIVTVSAEFTSSRQNPFPDHCTCPRSSQNASIQSHHRPSIPDRRGLSLLHERLYSFHRLAALLSAFCFCGCGGTV